MLDAVTKIAVGAALECTNRSLFGTGRTAAYIDIVFFKTFEHCTIPQSGETFSVSVRRRTTGIDTWTSFSLSFCWINRQKSGLERSRRWKRQSRRLTLPMISSLGVSVTGVKAMSSWPDARRRNGRGSVDEPMAARHFWPLVHSARAPLSMPMADIGCEDGLALVPVACHLRRRRFDE